MMPFPDDDCSSSPLPKLNYKYFCFKLFLSNFTIRMLEEMREKASVHKYTPVLSFLGGTESGKSHITNELLSFSDRKDGHGPKVAPQNQKKPTTRNIQAFYGEIYKKDKYRKLIIFDVEGKNGDNTPKMLQGALSQAMVQ